MENNLLHVKIITATGEVIEDDCLLLNAFLSDGEVGIMQGHLPLVGILFNFSLFSIWVSFNFLDLPLL